MRKGLFRRNDKGSALIVVIVAMLFIGIIAAIVLSIAHSNLEISQSGKKSTSTFYKGEVALDELKTNLKKIADDAIKEAYEEWLKNYTLNYAHLSKEDQTLAFRGLFADKFNLLIKPYFKTPLGDPSKSYGDLLYNSDVTVDGTPQVVIDSVTKNLRIKGISVTEEDAGYITNIMTDLVFNVITPTIKIGSQTGVDAELAQYALITDQTIDFTNSNFEIMGSVYGGGKKDQGDGTYKDNGAGILVSGSANVTISAADIVSRSYIETNNGGNLVIKGRLAGESDDAYAKVWVKNIWMNRVGAASRSTMDVKGNCYVGDDLTIDGDGASFKLTGSKSGYVGYATSSKSDESDTNSSIVVNGKNVKLDLSEASRLWLFGKTYVTVPARWGQIGGANQTYLQGESIAYRSLQAAYLLPGECIVGVYHNPMTNDEFTTILKPGTTEIDPDKIVISNVNYTGLNLMLYLNESKPVYAAQVSYGGQTLWYLYMNFSNPNNAAEYMQAYSKVFEKMTESRASMANAGADHALMKVNTGDQTVDTTTGAQILGKYILNINNPNESDYKVINTGNIMTYDGTNMVLWGRNVDYTSPFVISKKNDLLMAYQCMTTTLQDNARGSLNKDVTDTLVNYSYITGAHANVIEQITDGSDYYFNLDGYESTKRLAYVVSADGDVRIDSHGNVYFGGSLTPAGTPVTAGIIIAKGKVKIESLDFWGMVISREGIEFTGTGKVRADYLDVRKLLQSNEIVIPYFSENAGDTIGDSGSVTGLVDIVYDNWKKD